jgi:hypothetical protein
LENVFPVISDGKFYNINSILEAGKGKILSINDGVGVEPSPLLLR